MNRAKKKSHGDYIFSITELRKKDNDNLICQCCSAKIQYVSRHNKEASKSPIAAYLKLWQNISHADDCRYTVSGAIKHLVADSEKVENIPPVFKAETNNRYLFRMNIVVDSLKVAEQLQKIPSTSLDKNDNFLIGQDFIKTRKQLASYLNSATGIATLRASIEDASEIKQLEESLIIQYKDQNIKWKDFYYDDSRYHLLFNRMERGRIIHPVAINLTVKYPVRLSQTAAKFSWSFQCFSENNDSQNYSPTIYIANEELVSHIQKDKTYLIVGDVWHGTNKSSKYINIKVFVKEQIKAEISEDNFYRASTH